MRLFVLWTTLPSLVLIIIALIFLKNQTKPLVKLAKAAERFGKGDYVNDFRASGSKKLERLPLNLIEWQKELIDTLIKELKCFQELVTIYEHL